VRETKNVGVRDFATFPSFASCEYKKGLRAFFGMKRSYIGIEDSNILPSRRDIPL